MTTYLLTPSHILYTFWLGKLKTFPFLPRKVISKRHNYGLRQSGAASSVLLYVECKVMLTWAIPKCFN